MRGVVEAFELFALSLGRHSQLSNTTNGPRQVAAVTAKLELMSGTVAVTGSVAVRRAFCGSHRIASVFGVFAPQNSRMPGAGDLLEAQLEGIQVSCTLQLSVA